METFLDQIAKFSDPTHTISLLQLFVSLSLTFILCLIEGKTYQKTYKGASFSPAFMHTLIICGLVISAVMIIIGSNIARAFSLVGALSIIRFRNAVKDPRDVAYIFLAMGIGMATGTGFYKIAIGLTIFVCSICIILDWIGIGESNIIEKIVSIRTPASREVSKMFNEILAKHSSAFSLLSLETMRAGSEAELSFLLKVKRNFEVDALIDDLHKLNPELQVQVKGSDHVMEL